MRYILLILVIVMSSCAYTNRDNYDPWIVDEDACRELVKVENCLKKFEKSNWLTSYRDNELKWNFPEYSIPEIYQAITDYEWVKDNKNAYYYLHNNPSIPLKIGKEMYDLCSAINKRNKYVMEYVEFLLYMNCKSDIILKQEPSIPAFENPFFEDLQNEILSIFNSCNTPLVDWSELINDDNKNYQVWLISKESDPDRESDTKITVFFDSNNKRETMRLFHPKN